MKQLWKLNLTMLLFAIVVLPLGVNQAKAAGPEMVEIINVANVFENICQSDAGDISGTSSRAEKHAVAYRVYASGAKDATASKCPSVLRYRVTFKRTNGTSGEITTMARPTAKRLLVNFCVGPQGSLERPCAGQGF